MDRRGRLVVGLALWVTVACAAAPPPPEPKPAVEEPDETWSYEPPPLVVKPGEELVEAAQAYSVGDPVRAVRILDMLPQDDPRREETAGLRAKAQADVDAIAKDWLEKMDEFVAKQQFRTGRARGLYLLEHFPLSPETRAAIEAKLATIKDGVAEARVEIREMRQQAADKLLRHDFVGGLRTLRRAEVMARKFNFRDALDIERQISAAEFRFAQEKVEPENVVIGRKPKTSRKRRSDKPTNGKTEPAAEAPGSGKIQELLRAGSQYRKKKQYHEAIVAFDNVRRLDPGNSAAKIALESLKQKRQDLIKSYLSRANEHLLKQDLKRAYLLFLDVKELDPDNEEAIEGIEMYRNLERIRRQRNN